MPDETIGIISALNEAGLLGTAPTASGAAGVIGVLSEAGLLRTGAASGVAAGPPPPQPFPAHQVGDTVYIWQIRQIGKEMEFGPDRKVTMRLWNAPTPGTWEYYRCEFPPSDDEYLPEFDKIIQARTSANTATQTRTRDGEGSTQTQHDYTAKVTQMWVEWNTPEPSAV